MTETIVEYLKSYQGKQLQQYHEIDTKFDFMQRQVLKHVGFAFLNIMLQNKSIIQEIYNDTNNTTESDPQLSMHTFVGRFCLNKNVIETIKLLKETNTRQTAQIVDLHDQINKRIVKKKTDEMIATTRIKELEKQNTSLTQQIKSQNTSLTTQINAIKSQNTSLTTQINAIKSQNVQTPQNVENMKENRCMDIVFGENKKHITNIGDLFDWLSPIDSIRYIPKGNSNTDNGDDNNIIAIDNVRHLTTHDILGIFNGVDSIFSRKTQFKYYFINDFDFHKKEHRKYDILLITFHNANVKTIVIKLIHDAVIKSVGGTKHRYMSIRRK